MKTIIPKSEPLAAQFDASIAKQPVSTEKSSPSTLISDGILFSQERPSQPEVDAINGSVGGPQRSDTSTPNPEPAQAVPDLGTPQCLTPPHPSASLSTWKGYVRATSGQRGASLDAAARHARQAAKDAEERARLAAYQAGPRHEVTASIPNQRLGTLAESESQTLRPRIQCWEDPEPTNRHYNSTVVVDSYEKADYRGRFKGWSLKRHKPIYTSYLRIAPGGLSADYVRRVGNRIISKKAPAPRGFRWLEDGALLRLRDRMDYHPMGEDIEAGTRALAAKARTEMDRNINLRRASQQADRINAAQLKAEIKAARLTLASKGHRGLMVTLEDSSAAGNCRAGSIAFIKRYALPVPCPAQALLKAAKKTTPKEARQARAAILMAIKRIGK